MNENMRKFAYRNNLSFPKRTLLATALQWHMGLSDTNTRARCTTDRT